MALTKPRAAIAQTAGWTEVTAVTGVVQVLEDCFYCYNDATPPSTLVGSSVGGGDYVNNPSNAKLWLKPSSMALEYIVHEF